MYELRVWYNRKCIFSFIKFCFCLFFSLLFFFLILKTKNLDPRQWSEEHVVYWLNWATKEFSLECVNIEPFAKMRGRDMVALGREGFLAIAPPFTGDILWEHLEILQKGLSHTQYTHTHIKMSISKIIIQTKKYASGQTQLYSQCRLYSVRCSLQIIIFNCWLIYRLHTLCIAASSSAHINWNEWMNNNEYFKRPLNTEHWTSKSLNK